MRCSFASRLVIGMAFLLSGIRTYSIYRGASVSALWLFVRAAAAAAAKAGALSINIGGQTSTNPIGQQPEQGRLSAGERAGSQSSGGDIIFLLSVCSPFRAQDVASSGLR